MGSKSAFAAECAVYFLFQKGTSIEGRMKGSPTKWLNSYTTCLYVSVLLLSSIFDHPCDGIHVVLLLLFSIKLFFT